MKKTITGTFGWHNTHTHTQRWPCWMEPGSQRDTSMFYNIYWPSICVVLVIQTSARITIHNMASCTTNTQQYITVYNEKTMHWKKTHIPHHCTACYTMKITMHRKKHSHSFIHSEQTNTHSCTHMMHSCKPSHLLKVMSHIFFHKMKMKKLINLKSRQMHHLE